MQADSSLRAMCSWGAFVGAYLAAWFLSTVLPTPLLWFHPLEHRFHLAVHADAPAMDFYGRVLLSLLVGAGTAGAVFVATRRVAPRSLRTLIPMLIVWAAGILLLTAGLYAFTLYHRQPVPLPLPAGELEY